MAKDLKHFGVLGMHWGVHRSRPSSSDFTETQGLRKKSARELSNVEIRKVVTRLQLEKQYNDLKPKGPDYSKAVKLAGTFLASKFGQSLIKNLMKRYSKVNMDDIFGKDSPFDVSGAQDGQVIDLKFLKEHN